MNLDKGNQPERALVDLGRYNDEEGRAIRDLVEELSSPVKHST
jgi:hypothetical protein